MRRLFEIPRLYDLAGSGVDAAAETEFGDNACKGGSGDDNGCYYGSEHANGCGAGASWNNGCGSGGTGSASG